MGLKSETLKLSSFLGIRVMFPFKRNSYVFPSFRASFAMFLIKGARRYEFFL